MTTLKRGPGGSFIAFGRGRPAEGTLYQTDYDFPALAQSMGWSLLQVQVDKDGKVVRLKRVHRDHSKVNCRHAGTDGTVDCHACGLKAGDFISAAAAWLDERVT